MTYLYDFSGGMESAAMLWVCREEIKSQGAVVRWVNTGKQFPEMADSITQIEEACELQIVKLTPNMTFDEYLFDKGGMLRQGYNDCSRRMKRRALREHANSFPRPITIALGFNADEDKRGEMFSERNNKSYRTFVFPLQDKNIDRLKSITICERAGFDILLSMYRKMGRFDCFFCPNQKISQAEKVMRHYPAQWAEWKTIESKKGHPILSISAEAIEKRAAQDDFIAALDRKPKCSCFGGSDVYDED